MSRLSEFLKDHCLQTQRPQKDLAGAFHAEHTKLAPAEPLKWDTVPPKLTKLLKGEPEGERFFFDDPRRLEALAIATGLDQQRLRALRAIRTLVLDPRLPEPAKEYFRARAQEVDAQHHCAEVTAGAEGPPAHSTLLGERAGGSRTELHTIAKANPGCLVVLHEPADASYFEGAQVEVTFAKKHSRGWILTTSPDLVPLPPPPPPRSFDDDGTPMLASEDFAQLLREWTMDPHDRGLPPVLRQMPHERCVRLKTRLVALESEGAVPTFRLDEIGPWLSERAGRHVTWLPPLERLHDHGRFTAAELALHCFRSLSTEPSRTVAWTYGGRVFAVGPESAWVSEAVAPHGPTLPSSFAAWKAALADWNPWVAVRRGGGTRSRWDALANAVRQDCGVDIEHVRAIWFGDADPEMPAASSWVVSFGSVDERERALAQLHDLLQRKFELAPGAVHLLFRLKLALSATLLLLPRAPRDRIHLVANVGAGHLLRVRVLEFPREDATLIRLDGDVFDGGDVRIIVQQLRDDVLLEASPLVAVRRREEAARNDDD